MTDTNPKHIIITGVTRGLGRAMAERFIATGNHVAGCGRSKTAIHELRDTHPSPHHWQTVDVADAESVNAWADQLLQHFGPPDLLINNAALINKNADLWNVPANEFSDLINVNIKGVHHVIRAFVPAMIERGQGVIVNFSSGWGRSTAPQVAPYCASKWAIEGLTKALAQELPPGLAAVALNPGVINTDMLQSCFGPNASTYPTPDQWAQHAVPFILKLNATNNGESATAGC